jgi:hypothetical protein
MNYGLNARANVLLNIYDESIGKKKKEKKDSQSNAHKRFSYNIRKVETKHQHRRGKERHAILSASRARFI